jgi:hypothetical protein
MSSTTFTSNQRLDVNVVDFPTDKLTVLKHVDKVTETAFVDGEVYEGEGTEELEPIPLPHSSRLSIYGVSSKPVTIHLEYMLDGGEEAARFRSGQTLTVTEDDSTYAHTFVDIGAPFVSFAVVHAETATFTMHYSYF